MSCGEYFREYEFLDQSLSSVKVRQYPEAEYGLGSTVWDAALVLCAFLESTVGREMIDSSICLELGSGTGIAAIVASVVGAKISIATDVVDCIPFIRQNIELNCTSNCTATALDWAEDIQPLEAAIDWILCADCVYEPRFVDNLIKTILSLSPHSGIIVSNERRTTPANSRAERDFAAAMQQHGFIIHTISRDILREDWRCEDIDVVVFKHSSKQ